MNSWARLIPIVAMLLAWPSQAADDQQNLHFVETETTLELTVPAGGVWLVIPCAGFERLRPLESGAPGPRSFDLVNRERGIEILGAFDSASRYPGLRRYWADELEAMKLEEAPEPGDIRITRDGGWEIVAYKTEDDGERTSHVRAQAVKDQVWIDVHIEVASSEAHGESREVALAILRGFGLRKE
jgi:hypothetical protein